MSRRRQPEEPTLLAPLTVPGTRAEVRTVDTLAEEDRQLLIASIFAVKPTRRARARRVALVPYETHGRAALEAPRKVVKRAYVARIYYLSEGGEYLAADFGGLTACEADALAGAGLHTDALPAKAHVVARNTPRVWRAGKDAPALPAGLRLVTFPSEVPDPVALVAEVAA